jgi:hypothetical protein
VKTGGGVRGGAGGGTTAARGIRVGGFKGDSSPVGIEEIEEGGGYGGQAAGQR